MKKIMIGLLIFAFTLTIFMACGGGQASPTTTGTGNRVVTPVANPRPLTVTPQYGEQADWPQPATSYSTNPLYPQQPAISNTNGFPIVQEPITMRVTNAVHPSVLDFVDNDLTRFMEELTNVRIEWDNLPLDGAGERLNIMFAAGDRLPDMVYSASLGSVFQISVGSAGLLIPLQDLIEEHGFHLKKMFEFDPMIVPAMTSADGNIYAISDRASQTANQVNMRFWVFQPFLDALGMTIPRTTEELYRYLVAVRDRDPNGNGRRDEIPLVGSTTGWQMRIDGYLMNAFTFNDLRHRFVRDDSGRISTTVTTPEWRQGLEYMRRLNAEDLLISESFTLVQAEVRALVEAPGDAMVGSLTAGGHQNFTDPNGIRYTQYRVADPLIGPTGRQLTFFDEFALYRTGRIAISRDCLIPEVVIKWADYNFSADFFTRNRYGVLGRDWVIPPPGTVSVSGGQAMHEEILRWGTPQNAHWANVGTHWDRFASYDRAVSPDPFELEKVLWDARVAYWPHRFMHSVPATLPFTADEARIYNDLTNSITNYVNQTMAAWVVGNQPLNDSTWNAYLQNINNLGLAQLLQVTQSAFDRSWAEVLGYRR